jgi:3-hydroxy acid dehydrogenase / malonic semialdehyde reductase
MLKGKTVFITGASSGIGVACAEYFAKTGARLLLCARRQDLLLKQAENLRATYNSEVLPIVLDVRDHAAIKAALEALPPEWQAIEVLVNNAGLAAGLDSVQEGNIQDWEDMIDTNVKGLLYMTRYILPGMINRNAGHVINIGSISGHYVYPKGAVYCATKFAVNALSQGLRMDLLGTKIRVSTIDPGAVETNFSNVRFKGDTQRAAAVYEGMKALTPEDVADAVLYCVTRPSHVNVSEIILMPTDQVSVNMVSRKAK